MWVGNVNRLAGCLVLSSIWLFIWPFGVVSSFAEDEPPPSAVGPVLRLYQSGRLPPARQPAVVEMICSRGNSHDLRVVFDQLLAPDGMEESLRLQTLDWLLQAARQRRVKPEGDRSAIVQLMESPEPALKSAAVELAAAWQVAEVAPTLRAIAEDPDVSMSLHRIAIQGLVALEGEEAEPTLAKIARSGSSPLARMHAVSALAGINGSLAAELATEVIIEADPRLDLGPMLNAFFERRDGAELLGTAFEARQLDPDTAKRVIRYMFAIGRSDSELITILSEAAGVSPDPQIPTAEEVAELSRDALEHGDAARGERVFRRNDLNCFRCHALQGAGGEVGPDLSPLGASSPIDYVVNSILNPDIAVKEQYATRVFETLDGRVLTGVVIDRDNQRVRIRDAQGETIVIPTADIDYEAEGRSMMPEGLTKFLTRDDLLDLIRFVAELGKPGPYGPRSASILQRWQKLEEPPAELIDDVPHLEHLRQYVFDSADDHWSPLYAMFSGKVPLDELRSDSESSLFVLRGEIHVHQAGELAVEATLTETGQIWVGTQSIVPGSVEVVSLDAGRHYVTARIELSEREEPTLMVEFRRPEGSTIQWEVVGGP
jgi:putative heme-binding domain-containing protein